jgi:hypothetical protein
MGEVQNFARQQPAAFFGAAVLAGFAAVRFFKSAPEHSGYSSSPQRSSGSRNTAYGTTSTGYAGTSGSSSRDAMGPMGMQR